MRMTPDQQAEIAAAREVKTETRRPTVAALEEILYQPIEVLDHGFVRVIDYMGDDAAIVQAARVSYGKGTKKVTEDRGLIRYLMRHRHTTPFEMCELKLHCKLPIFVARQWIRHRSACLAGDTRLLFDLPNALRKGRRQSHSMPIEKLHRLWHEGASITSTKKKPTFVERVRRGRSYGIPELARIVERREEDLRNLVRWGRLEASKDGGRIVVRGAAWHAWAAWSRTSRFAMRDRLSKMMLRSCDEETGEIGHTRVVDIWETGSRPVFRVTLENGYSVKMTKDHRCLTERGWLTLEQATSLRWRVNGGVTWDGAAPALSVNGVPVHRSREWLAAQKARGLGLQEMAEASGVTTHTIRKALRSFGLQFTASERSRRSGLAQRGSPAKRRPTPRRLARQFSRIVRIEAAGVEKTYDLEVAGPWHNFVANGFIVHNSVNEYSARYSILDREFYVPAPADLGVQAKSNRQGRGEVVSPERAAEVLKVLKDDAELTYAHYQDFLNLDDAGNPLRPGEPGLARELARMNLTLAYYTQWYWKIDLHNLLHFLSLRMDDHAQMEIRVYADAIAKVVERWVPHAWEAFRDYRQQGMHLSRAEIDVVRRMLRGEKPDLEAAGLSKREREELEKKLGI